MITYEFQVPPTYMPPDYRDGMRGLAGGIFRGSLGSLGDTASDLKAQAIAEFQSNCDRVRQEVQTAVAQVIFQSMAAGRPDISATFANNVAHLDSIARQVREGNVGKASAYATVAKALISQARELNGARWWQNLPNVEEWVAIIQAIPAKFAAAIVAAAGTAGGAAGAALQNAGIDPAKIVDTAGSTAKWIGVGAVALAALYLVSR